MTDRRRLALLGWCCLSAACAAAAPTATTTAPSAAVEIVAAASGEKPAWLDRAPFAETSSGAARIYGVGMLEVAVADLGTSCWDAGHAVKTAANRALAAIARIEQGRPTGEMQLEGAIAVSAWYDGAGKLYVLAAHRAPVSKAKDVPAVTVVPGGGSSLNAVASHLRTENRRLLEASGQCRDPAKRPSLPCCGRADELCEDNKRFDTQPAPGRCLCGKSAPCGFDFLCEKGRCVCRGPSCACDVLKCKVGQACADGRCF